MNKDQQGHEKHQRKIRCQTWCVPLRPGADACVAAHRSVEHHEWL
jgi:hypothetical protein